MAQQTINVGATANDGTGDGIRTAYIKCNDNFNELYNTTITPTSLPNGTSNVSVADSANVTISIASASFRIVLVFAGFLRVLLVVGNKLKAAIYLSDRTVSRIF